MTSRQVLIKPTSPRGPGLQFDLVGDEELTGGAGGWETLPRPRRRAALGWSGTPGYQTVLPLQLDGTERPRHGIDTPIEGDCRLLTSWGVRAKDADQPAVLRLAGPLQAPTQLRWVIQDIRWGAQIRDRRARRVQQQVTVTLIEYVAPTILKGPAAKSRAAGAWGRP